MTDIQGKFLWNCPWTWLIFFNAQTTFLHCSFRWHTMSACLAIPILRISLISAPSLRWRNPALMSRSYISVPLLLQFYACRLLLVCRVVLLNWIGSDDSLFQVSSPWIVMFPITNATQGADISSSAWCWQQQQLLQSRCLLLYIIGGRRPNGVQPLHYQLYKEESQANTAYKCFIIYTCVPDQIQKYEHKFYR